MPNDTKNTVIFIVCALALLLLYQTFVMGPITKRQQAEAKARAPAAQTVQPGQGAPAGAAPSASAGQSLTAPRAQAAAATPRVPINGAEVRGSLSLTGARIDDLFLKRYRETNASNSPQVELFRPAGAAHAYFAEFGWTGANVAGLPGGDTRWTVAGPAALRSGQPLTLTYRAPNGLAFTRTVALDRNYMFTVIDTVANLGAAPVTIAPYGSVQRHGLPADLAKQGVVHEGAVGVADGKLKLFKYSGWKKKQANTQLPSTGGWFGITEKYWLGAVVPDQKERVAASFRVVPSNGVDIYEAAYLGQYRTIAPGRQVISIARLFAGAKTVPLLRQYEQAGISKFDAAVDWGMFWFLTRPIFSVLMTFYHAIGNFGLAIMLLTVGVKILFFWPANKSYESITKMKKVQPQVEALRKKHKDDPAKQQQEMMALYQREKVNPFMGCLPMLIQIPVFFALYKVLSVTIEMRHAPFFGWIRDLSARDPTTIWNIFGLLPFDPSLLPMVGGLLGGPLHIGAWPILMGFSMWLSQSMTPMTGMDPIQQRIFQFFPLVFTFMLAPFAAGLVIYWTWNNLLSIAQQYMIMRRFGVDNAVDGIIRRLTGKPAPASG
ncbi:MAG TPA: membrane protein insertase YidC [Caulobacteraceae bacterium]|jgi:YidC/Oxa1 family membrane protein insertase